MEGRGGATCDRGADAAARAAICVSGVRTGRAESLQPRDVPSLFPFGGRRSPRRPFHATAVRPSPAARQASRPGRERGSPRRPSDDGRANSAIRLSLDASRHAGRPPRRAGTRSDDAGPPPSAATAPTHPTEPPTEGGRTASRRSSPPRPAARRTEGGSGGTGNTPTPPARESATAHPPEHQVRFRTTGGRHPPPLPDATRRDATPTGLRTRADRPPTRKGRADGRSPYGAFRRPAGRDATRRDGREGVEGASPSPETARGRPRAPPRDVDLEKSSVKYLVDPASNHMLVSKIKPCMSKYKCFILRNCGWLIISVIIYLIDSVTWITVGILELIHAKSPDRGQPREGRVY